MPLPAPPCFLLRESYCPLAPGSIFLRVMLRRKGPSSTLRVAWSSTALPWWVWAADPLALMAGTLGSARFLEVKAPTPCPLGLLTLPCARRSWQCRRCKIQLGQ